MEEFGGKTILYYFEIKITLVITFPMIQRVYIYISVKPLHRFVGKIMARGWTIGKRRSVIALSLWTGICTSLSSRVSRTKGD